MKIQRIAIMVLILAVAAAPVLGQTDGELFNKAKLSLFDKQWKQALKNLDTLLDKYPNSNFAPLALYYKAKCYEETDQPQEAVTFYERYIKESENEGLREEASVAIIDMYEALGRAGDAKYYGKVKDFLNSGTLAVRYYAAFKLSYVKDKSIARTAVPVLKRIASVETDQELVDRANIALMRIDPSYLKKAAERIVRNPTVLKIRVFNKQSKKDSLSLNIPFALARLALDALPEDDREKLKNAGYNIETIIDSLVETGEILKIAGDEEVLRIWIE